MSRLLSFFTRIRLDGTGLNEVLVLGLSENGDVLVELVNGLDDLGTIFGKVLPVDVGVLSHQF